MLPHVYSFIGTYATLFLSPLHPVVALCVLEHCKEQLRAWHRGQVYLEGAEHCEHGGGEVAFARLVSVTEEVDGTGSRLEDNEADAFCVEKDACLVDEGPGSLNSNTSLPGSSDVSSTTLTFKISEAACSSASTDSAISMHTSGRKTRFCIKSPGVRVLQ